MPIPVVDLCVITNITTEVLYLMNEYTKWYGYIKYILVTKISMKYMSMTSRSVSAGLAGSTGSLTLVVLGSVATPATETDDPPVTDWIPETAGRSDWLRQQTQIVTFGCIFNWDGTFRRPLDIPKLLIYEARYSLQLSDLRRRRRVCR